MNINDARARTRLRRTLIGAALIAVAMLPACTPTPTDPTSTTTETPAGPIINSFAVEGFIGNAPAVVAFSWNVSDPNGDQLTCAIDSTNDGTNDLVINNCSGVASRNITYPTAGTFTARFSVWDSSFPTVTTTRSVTVGAGTGESYDMVLRGTGSLTPAQAAAFSSAEAFWESVITRGTSDFSIAPRPGCLGADQPNLPSVIDDVIIDVRVTPIDGAGNVLGQAGPRCFNTGNDMPLVGIMEFDSADVANLLAAGTFGEVVRHEMGHVLGIGTLWDTTGFGGSRNIITGAGSGNPEFTGVRAVAEWSALHRSGKVPVEGTGGEGTVDSHWRESTFDNELMTGYLNSGFNPASALTVASLADMGYSVNLAAADPYSLPGAGMRSSGTPIENQGIVQRPPIAPA